VTQRGEVFDLMVDVMQALGRDLQDAAAEHRLTPMQAMLLDRLEDDVAAPMSDLAHQLHCDKSNLTGLVDALETLGLVERTTPPADRRVRALVTTERGRAIRRSLGTRLRGSNPLLARLSAGETTQLLRILQRLLQPDD
jgi:DNA-binding MarR family transcriptional regulator